MAPSPMRDSAESPCFHGCLDFLHRHFPPQSPPSHPLNSTLCSQQQPLPWDCFTIPKLQLPATAPSREPESLSEVCTALARSDSHSIQAATDQLFHSQPYMFLLRLRQLPRCGDLVSVSLPPPAKGRSSPNASAFSPSSFVLQSFAWFCMFFSSCQLLLSILSWCSACTSVSECVFLMYPWREMYSTSTYSSIILFSVFSFEIQKLL